VRIDLQTNISIFSFSLVVQRPELIGGALNVPLADSFIDFLDAFSLKHHGPNILIVIMAARNRLLKDGWIRGHPPQSVLLNQPPELAADDQIASDVVEPN
jgi:hypothetical protein